jgi:hypothetical protein
MKATPEARLPLWKRSSTDPFPDHVGTEYHPLVGCHSGLRRSHPGPAGRRGPSQGRARQLGRRVGRCRQADACPPGRTFAVSCFYPSPLSASRWRPGIRGRELEAACERHPGGCDRARGCEFALNFAHLPRCPLAERKKISDKGFQRRQFALDCVLA